jgi:2-hydroxychromene-2-carboxylate isomerase
VQEQSIKDDLKARTEAAVARGIFGLPTFFVGEKMWWGQDRLDWVKEALRA